MHSLTNGLSFALIQVKLIMTVRVILLRTLPFIIMISHFKSRIAPECKSCVRTKNCIVLLQLFKKDITEGKLKMFLKIEMR